MFAKQIMALSAFASLGLVLAAPDYAWSRPIPTGQNNLDGNTQTTTGTCNSERNGDCTWIKTVETVNNDKTTTTIYTYTSGMVRETIEKAGPTSTGRYRDGVATFTYPDGSVHTITNDENMVAIGGGSYTVSGTETNNAGKPAAYTGTDTEVSDTERQVDLTFTKNGKTKTLDDDATKSGDYIDNHYTGIDYDGSVIDYDVKKHINGGD